MCLTEVMLFIVSLSFTVYLSTRTKYTPSVLLPSLYSSLLVIIIIIVIVIVAVVVV
uniref:Tropomyosin n=1 Tax=Parascaris univalens TaxID=6257 RepID=A0A915C7V8_PARUN